MSDYDEPCNCEQALRLQKELAEVTEDRDLWKQSEAGCSAAYNELHTENTALKARVAELEDQAAGAGVDAIVAMASVGRAAEAAATTERAAIVVWLRERGRRVAFEMEGNPDLQLLEHVLADLIESGAHHAAAAKEGGDE